MGVLPGHDFCKRSRQSRDWSHAPSIAIQRVCGLARPQHAPARISRVLARLYPRNHQASGNLAKPDLPFPVCYSISSLLCLCPLLFLSSFSSIYFPNEFPYRFHLSLSFFFLPSILLYLVPPSCSTVCSPIFLLYLFPLYFPLSIPLSFPFVFFLICFLYLFPLHFPCLSPYFASLFSLY